MDTTLPKKEKSDEVENKVEKIKKIINILLVEDNQADARLVTEYLQEDEEYNFNIIYADCLARALLEIKDTKLPIDAVILDLGLPDCTGLETFRRIWSEQDRMLPIIVLTGSILSRPNLRCCVEEAHEFLVKSYIDSHTLVNSILSGIEKQRARERIMLLNETRRRDVSIRKEVGKLETSNVKNTCELSLEKKLVDWIGLDNAKTKKVLKGGGDIANKSD